MPKFTHKSSMSKFKLRINSRTKKASIMPSLPKSEFKLRINPRTKKASIMPVSMKLREIGFSPRPKSKLYKRKKPLVPIDKWRALFLKSVPRFSLNFAVKTIKYVAAIICHGSSCDTAEHLLWDHPVMYSNPFFKTQYDMVFTSKYGDTSNMYGGSEFVGEYLCKSLNNKVKNHTGAEFMEILDSTIHKDATVVGGKHRGIGGALGKDTILTQKDIETKDVTDLNIFMDGDHSRNDNDSIFLFKIGSINDCANVNNHNALAVNPEELLKRMPELDYVAQTARNLKRLIEPTGASLIPKDKTNTTFWSDATYQLKEFSGDPDPDNKIVRLSDIIGKKNIFPPDTVVVVYVCRSTLVDKMCSNSPNASDYSSIASTPVAHIAAMSETTPPSPGAPSAAVPSGDGDDWSFDIGEPEPTSGPATNDWSFGSAYDDAHFSTEHDWMAGSPGQ